MQRDRLRCRPDLTQRPETEGGGVKEFATPGKDKTIRVYPEYIEVVEKKGRFFRTDKTVHAMSLVHGVSLPPGSNTVTLTISMTIGGREMSKEYSYEAVDAMGLFNAILANMPRSDGSGLF
jgi:hypothetical protein